MRVFCALAMAGLLVACASAPTGLPPVAVTAMGETAPVGTANEDAADDPAIWRNVADPAASLIVATDKKAGLYVYDLTGKVRGFYAAGAVNNVDVATVPGGAVIVAASDRNDLANAKIRLWELDTKTGALTEIGSVPGGAGEGYGFCMMQTGGTLMAYSVLKDGRVEEIAIIIGGQTIVAENQRSLAVPSQAEGCVVDPRDGTLYVGEENAGIWRFAKTGTAGELVAPIDNQYLVADVEGLALVPRGQSGGYLVASSQGDNAYAVFRLPDMAPLGRFSIAAGTLGAAEETDGIELVEGDFGPDYPGGLFVAQDGMNAPAAQNFKLVDWGAIKAAMGLE